VIHDHVDLIKAAAHHHLPYTDDVGVAKSEEDVDLSQGVHREALLAGGAGVEFHLKEEGRAGVTAGCERTRIAEGGDQRTHLLERYNLLRPAVPSLENHAVRPL